MVLFSFANHIFHALAQPALFWPARQALIVADLHLEKGSWFAAGGQFLPPYDSMRTLDWVARLVERTGARTLYCLGDSFHDSDGVGRLPEAAQAQLRNLTSALDWIWITGNHDVELTAPYGGRLVHEVEIDGLMLRHEGEPLDPRPELSGHFHPKFRLKVRGQSLSRRCFVVSESKLILPAFGALTGGLDAHHPEIIRLVGKGAEALVGMDDRLLRFPIMASA